MSTLRRTLFAIGDSVLAFMLAGIVVMVLLTRPLGHWPRTETLLEELARPVLQGAVPSILLGLACYVLRNGWRLSPRVLAELAVSLALVVSFMQIERSVQERWRANGRILSCRFQLKVLGAAVRAYAEEHGAFPPAVEKAAEGRKRHSWRAAVLRRLDEQEAHSAYDFTQPWDAPQNLAVGRMLADVFECPADLSRKPERGHTNYVAIVGDESLWGAPWQESSPASALLRDILLAVEQRAPPSWPTRVATLEPRDLELSDLEAALQDPVALAACCNYREGFNAVFADGHAELLSVEDPGQLQRRIDAHRTAVRAYLGQLRQLSP